MEKFIKDLEKLGLSLHAKNGNLILSGRDGKLSAEEISRINNDKHIPSFIRENKARLVEHLSQSDGDHSSAKLKADKISAVYQLSPLQEGMLFHSLYADNATAYITQFRLDFPEGINVEAFRMSWDFVIRKHSILRTAFIYDRVSIPLQCVYKRVTLPFEVLDFSPLPAAERQPRFDDLLIEDRKRGFDFATPPLTRITLVKTDAKAYKMIWTKHHILWDGWSGQIIISEVLNAYAQYVNGQKPNEVDEDLYQDYIKYINAIDTYKERVFWEEYMRNFEEPALLPFTANTQDRNKGTGVFREMTLPVDQALTEKINSYVQTHHITVNTLVQGVWSVLLFKYTGSPDVIFGTVVSGRPADVKFDKKVGLYINTLPLRAQLHEDQKVSDWLFDLQKKHVKAREYQYTSLNNIQQWSGLRGDLFDSIIVFRNYPLTASGSSEKPIVKIENVSVEENNNYLLSIQANLHDQLILEFKYNGDLLDTLYVQMIKSHFYNALKQIVEDPNLKLCDISIVSASERGKLLQGFNATQRVYPKEKTVVQLFEEQATLHPDKVAVVFEDKPLTYKEINERANQVAHYLRKRGITTELRVGICIERSLEMVVGLLGILKSGGAYVPIDPAYPTDRIKYILSDSDNPLVLVASSTATLLSDEGFGELLVDINDRALLSESTENLPLIANANNLVYVIYTSGSTGKPKGVMIENQSLVNFLVAMADVLKFTADDSILALTTFSFDISYLEMYLPLTKGGKVIVASRTSAMDGFLLQAMIDNYRPSFMQATPATWQLLIDCGWKNKENITILTGGEAISETLKESLTTLSDQKVWNLFGPTETTIWSTIKELRTGEKVTIGKPINNTQTYILDERLQIVPIGVKGELCIGGDGVGRGYLNREELTREKFVENPFVSQSASKLYKTGDVARWLPDGNIEYLGRVDSQVKIRGYRIELGEIENILQQSLLAVKNVVLTKEDSRGVKRLIAYVVPQAGYTRAKMLQYLKSKLPEYMVPSLIIELETIPLTANGKLDRKALPNPEAAELATTTYVAPRNEMEERLVDIWQNLLSMKRIGIHHNFFELGGHSLLAVRAISAIQQQFGIKIPVATYFQLNTIAALSDFIDLAKSRKTTKESEEYQVFDL
jgi:amino acid adenylation domain-containing protein